MPSDLVAALVDFDGATLTHVGAKVTFEVLVTSLELANHPALNCLGSLVRYLGFGGISVAEAAGLESIIRGIHQRLTEAGNIFDSLYLAYFGNDA